MELLGIVKRNKKIKRRLIIHLLHKWGKWSKPFPITVKKPVGHFGDVNNAIIMIQTKECAVCGKIKSRIVAEGFLDEDRKVTTNGNRKI